MTQCLTGHKGASLGIWLGLPACKVSAFVFSCVGQQTLLAPYTKHISGRDCFADNMLKGLLGLRLNAVLSGLPIPVDVHVVAELLKMKFFSLQSSNQGRGYNLVEEGLQC